MANRPIRKILIDADMILRELKKRNLSIRALGREPLIDRNERTIRTYLKAGEMPPELIEKIACFFNMPPDLFIL